MRRLVLFLLLTRAFCGGVYALADENIEAGRRALQEAGDFPWYDAEADQLRRVPLKPIAEPQANYSEWEAPAGPNWLANFFAQLAPFIRWFVWALIVAAAVGLLALLAYALTRRQGGVSPGGAGVDVLDLRREEESIERLPFQLRQPKADLLSEIRRQYEAGKYKEAIVYLFSYQLVLLDRYHHIHLAKGKTNRQYLREMGAAGELRRLLRGTMSAFEDVFFGDHSLDRQGFEACWKSLDEFQRLTAEGSP